MRGLLLSSIKNKQPPVAGELLALQGAAPEGAAGQHGAEWAATIGAKITEMAITKTVVMEATGILNIWSGKGGKDSLRHRKRCSELVIDTTNRCHYAFGSQRRATLQCQQPRNNAQMGLFAFLLQISSSDP